MEQTIYSPNTGEDFEANSMLPCPFCGKEPKLTFKGNDYTKTRTVKIKCSNWHCGVNVITAGIRSDSKQVALWSIEKWNNRIV